MSWLLIFLLLFGFGCAIGAAYALIRYGIPTFVWCIGQICAGIREGWREGGERIKQIEAARQARQARRQ
ncbi:hypothetical protein G7K71_08645 [Desulfofundulus sp. TPOSR]|uniref:hypothetical protein n=1 Tax=Desulfofundulus sp. TPOSR TaxID=2714340 RepID=UPI001408E972|nr:hypothetical protein [Desulfofundulus sp. TPOSR]NHM25464.1 hypothetical protein [Desulfofundulus sp. TPOSR]NHM27052.1 hypothetical protein [Desulfofundulus sp. TPOSR]